LGEIIRAEKPFVACFAAQLLESGDCLFLEELCVLLTLGHTPH
jgi:hypothetical protein